MIKYLAVLIFILSACGHSKVGFIEEQENKQDLGSVTNPIYKVYKIDSINRYYLIYARRLDTLYKIVSEKQNTAKCDKIKTGNEYPLVLQSVFRAPVYINGINVSGGYSFNIKCMAFDNYTTICIENSINDLHIAKNVKGLCVLK